MSSRPPHAGNALSLGLFLFPALRPSRIFLAFILILGNMNEGNQAGMQWSQTHTDRIPIKRGLEIIIDLLPTPSSTFLFFLCPLLPFLRHTVGLNRSAVHWSCAFSRARTHTFRGKRPHAVSLKTLTVCAVNQTPSALRSTRMLNVRYDITSRDKRTLISNASTRKRAPPLSVAVAREIRQFDAVYKALYSERIKRKSSNRQR